MINFQKENEKLRQYVLSNTEVQKIVGDNKKLNSKVAKLENELYQNINNIKDLELSHQKDLSKFDPFYGEKNDIYENNLDNNYNPNYKQEYNKQFPLERKYENYENDKNQDPYYYNNENHSDYRLNSNYQPYNNDNKQYNQKINNKHNENIPFLDQSNKKIFSKHQSPTLKRYISFNLETKFTLIIQIVLISKVDIIQTAITRVLVIILIFPRHQRICILL